MIRLRFINFYSSEKKIVCKNKKMNKYVRYSFPQRSIFGTRQGRRMIVVPKSAREKPVKPFLEPEDEFRQPEYLQQIKNQLKQDIQQLKEEIKPLSDSVNKIQEQYAKDQHSPRTKEFKPENWMSSQLAQMHGEYEQLADELAELRRHYSEQTEAKLQNDIEYQHKLLDDLKADCAVIFNDLRNFNNKEQEILNSESTLVIKSQKREIEQLKKDLSSLNAREQEMIDQYMEIVNDVPSMIQTENLLSQKRRQLKQAEYDKMKTNNELRRLKKDFEDQINRLKLEIARKEEEIRVKANRDTWKRKSGMLKSSHSSVFEKTELDTPKTPLRVTFAKSVEGFGIPEHYSASPSPRKLSAIPEGEDENEEENDDEDVDTMLDLGKFTPKKK